MLPGATLHSTLKPKKPKLPKIPKKLKKIKNLSFFTSPDHGQTRRETKNT